MRKGWGEEEREGERREGGREGKGGRGRQRGVINCMCVTEINSLSILTTATRDVIVPALFTALQW